MLFHWWNIMAWARISIEHVASRFGLKVLGVPKRHLLLTDPSVPHQQHGRKSWITRFWALRNTFLEVLNDKRCQYVSELLFFEWKKRHKRSKQITPLESSFLYNKKSAVERGERPSTGRNFPSSDGSAQLRLGELRGMAGCYGWSTYHPPRTTYPQLEIAGVPYDQAENRKPIYGFPDKKKQRRLR